MGGSISKKNVDGEEDATMRGGEVVGAGGAHTLGGGAMPPSGAAGSPGAGAGAAGAGAPRAVPPASLAAGPGRAAGGAGAEEGGGAPAAGAGARVVPTVFRWEHGGNSVYITGTFNGWDRKIPLHRSGNDFLSIQNLPATLHAYKFVVDDEWRFAPDLPTMTDVEGNINNIIDLTHFNLDEVDREEDCVPWSTGTRAAALVRRRDSFKDTAPYGTLLPDEDMFSKEPPNLPPQLRHIILNTPHPPSPEVPDPMQTPTPMHVTLNHLCACALGGRGGRAAARPGGRLAAASQVLAHSAPHPSLSPTPHTPPTLLRADCTAIRDGLMMQATTGRYRRKCVGRVNAATFFWRGGIQVLTPPHPAALHPPRADFLAPFFCPQTTVPRS